MAKFNPYVHHVLTKLYDDNFVDEITETINEILPLLIKGDLTIFENNTTNNELLSSLKINESNFHKTLTYEAVSEAGVRNKTGFNKLTILTIFFEQDITEFLNELPADFTQVAIQLDNIFKSFNNDFRYFKCISQNVQTYESLLCDAVGDEDIPYRLFNLMYNRIGNVDTDTNDNSFIYIYAFFILYTAYSKLTKYKSTVHYNVIDGDQLQPSDIVRQFHAYYKNNDVAIVNSIEEYCYTNLFRFSGNYTTLFDSVVDTAISDSISRLTDIFEANIDTHTNGPVFFSNLLSTTVEQISYYSAISRLTDETNSFYDYLPNLFDVDDFSSLILEEERIYKDIKDYAIANINDLEYAEYVSWKFNVSPLFFINSHIPLHYQYASNIMTTMKIPFNIEQWKNKFSFTSDRNDKFRQYLIDQPFVYDSKIVFRCGYYLFSDLITRFMDSAEVTEWIISDFFPSLINAVNSNYLKDLDYYKFIDNIRWILKLMFIQSIFNGDVFDSYLRQLNAYLNESIVDKYEVDLSDIRVDILFNNFPSGAIERLLNGTFKSAYVNNYLNSLTSKYSI